MVEELINRLIHAVDNRLIHAVDNLREERNVIGSTGDSNNNNNR